MRRVSTSCLGGLTQFGREGQSTQRLWRLTFQIYTDQPTKNYSSLASQTPKLYLVLPIFNGSSSHVAIKC